MLPSAPIQTSFANQEAVFADFAEGIASCCTSFKLAGLALLAALQVFGLLGTLASGHTLDVELPTLDTGDALMLLDER